jgi:hypothetical protein
MERQRTEHQAPERRARSAVRRGREGQGAHLDGRASGEVCMGEERMAGEGEEDKGGTGESTSVNFLFC